MTIGQRQMLQALAAEKDELGGALGDIDRLIAEHRKNRAALVVERNQALADFAGAVLPELTREATARAIELTACQALVADDPLARLERERAAAERRVAEIDADPRYRDRELLRAPRTGTLVRKLEELEEFRAPLAETLAAAAHPRLERLLQGGYGTDAYAVGWWRLSYYADWKAADEIVEKFKGKTSFADVRAEVLEARSSIVVYDEQIAQLRAEIEAGAALEAERGRLAAMLAELPQRVLADARSAIAGHVAGLETGDLAERVRAVPDLALLWKKASGLGAKLDYLDKIVEEELVKPRRELELRRQKSQADLTKWSRPKYAAARFPDDQFQRRFVERRGRARRGIDRYQKTYRTVYVYDAWDRPSLVEDLLWWDIMTGGRWGGGYIPQVAAFRETHPEYRYDPALLDRDDADAAAASAVAPHDLVARDVS